MRKPNVKMLTKKVVLSGIFLALALIVSLIESYIPPIIPILPYAKIGLGNVILLACFLLVGWKEGYIVLLLRCVLNAVFAGNISMLLWSLPSALVAYTIMLLLSKARIFSITGISVVGGGVHNAMQIFVASAIVGKAVFAYLPYMLLAGFLSGLVTGIVCYFCVKALTRTHRDNYVYERETAPEI